MPQQLSLRLTDHDFHEPVEPLGLTDELRQSIRLNTYVPFARLEGDHVLVIVPTENEHKVATTKAVMQKYFGSRLGTVWTQKASSGVAEQPIGPEQGARGACGRINDALDKLAFDNGFKRYLVSHNIGRIVAVSVESFITDSDHPTDYAFVILSNPFSGGFVAGFSRGCEFPLRYVNEAQTNESISAGLTVGKIIEKHNPGIAHHDPHRALCGSSRYTLLTDAFERLMHGGRLDSL